MSPCTGDRGSIVLGWLTKLAVGFALAGVVVLDAISFGAAQFQTEDHANLAARAAADAYGPTKDLQRAYDAAAEAVAEHGDRVDPASFAADPDGTITLTLTADVSSLVVHRISALEDLTTVSKTVKARQAG